MIEPIYLLVREIFVQGASSLCSVVDTNKQFLRRRDRVLSAQYDILIFHGVELILGELLLCYGMCFLFQIMEVKTVHIVGGKKIEHHSGDDDQTDSDTRIDERDFSSCFHFLNVYPCPTTVWICFCAKSSSIF